MVVIRTTNVGKVDDIKQLENVIVAFISNLRSTKYKTELIKLCFILDYKYCKKFRLDKGPTTVEYIKYNYGPYSNSFVEAIESLKEKGIITETSLAFGAGYALSTEISLQLTPEVMELLQEVINEYGEKTLREMKNYIYALPEFVHTDFGNAISFN
jgi:uncharacterized protein YwgA